MKSLLAFGDSNTWGLIPGSKPHKRYPLNVRWTGVLANEAPALHIIEEGLCGRTTVFEDALRPGRRGLSSLPGILESQSPVDAAILMLGTNDCKSVYNASPYTIGKGIELCLDVLEQYVDASKILLISPIELGDEVHLPHKDPEFSKASIATSRELKNVYGDIAGRRGNLFLAASDIVTASSVDDEHIDEAGHRVFAQEVLKILKKSHITL